MFCMSKNNLPKAFLEEVSLLSGSRYLNIINPDHSSDIIDSYTGEILIEGINMFRSYDIKERWNLQEYEGIDDTEGHL